MTRRNAMRCKSLVLALTAIGGVASAQPGPPPQPVDTTTTTTTNTNETTPVVTTTTTPVVNNQPMQQPVQASEPAGNRPEGMAMGLGIGYDLPTSLETPNTASFRLRLAG